ncbi:MFS transporter [Salinisphaera sp. USBA-960]|uniref:CynX/NimT family MFS transporter n=1 Tax=Salinisphaera orenii TaxID=856731 RepID=UPI000DBE9A9D|nr:MFS transporter [Salifodinibacter halophilus]NNC25609.1 MFS transporter [Salifodinibacter halophilus]
MSQADPTQEPRIRRLLTLAGLLLVALNLRPAITSVSPVLSRIGQDLQLAATGQGILTTLPVFFLGVAAPLAPRLARKIGPERAVLAVLAALALVLIGRPYIGLVGLFLGTAVAGGCIGVLNVLLPSLVKRDFPRNVGLATGLYTMFLNLGASLAAGVTEPLRLNFGDWRPALAFWLVPAVIAGLAWFAQMHTVHKPSKPSGRPRHLYRNVLAWQVTAFMALQSSLAYIVFGWLPTILADRGMAPVLAGLALSISVLLQVVSAVAVPAIAARMKDQRAALALVVAVTLIGLSGCLYAPISSIWVWVVVLGLGQGGSFAMALTLLALRASDADTAAELSGMAQGIGYVVAASGPLAVGLLHQAFGGWLMTGVLFGLIGAGAIVAGLYAGRDRLVGQ